MLKNAPWTTPPPHWGCVGHNEYITLLPWFCCFLHFSVSLTFLPATAHKYISLLPSFNQRRNCVLCTHWICADMCMFTRLTTSRIPLDLNSQQWVAVPSSIMWSPFVNPSSTRWLSIPLKIPLCLWIKHIREWSWECSSGLYGHTSPLQYAVYFSFSKAGN